MIHLEIHIMKLTKSFQIVRARFRLLAVSIKKKKLENGFTLKFR